MFWETCVIRTEMGIMLVLMIFLQVPLTNSEKGAVLNGIPHSCQLNHSEMKINGVIVRKQACDTSSERIYAGCNKDTVADGIKRRCPSTLVSEILFRFRYWFR